MEVFNNPEISFKILYNFSPKKIDSLCILNKNFSNICNDEYFWKKYCEINYFVTIKSKDVTWYYTAIYCYNVLQMLFSYNLFPTYRVLQSLIFKVNNPTIPYDSISKKICG